MAAFRQHSLHSISTAPRAKPYTGGAEAGPATARIPGETTLMRTTIAALSAAATLTCLTVSPPSAAQAEPTPVYIGATYYHCDNATISQADDAVTKMYKQALDAMITDKAVNSWGWLSHNTGGEWARAGYWTGPTIKAVMDASDALEAKVDSKGNKEHAKVQKAFNETCESGEDYIWHVLVGNDARGHRGKAAFSTYYVCDQARETQADALMKRVFAPMYDKLVADGKLISWAWAEHIVGGKYRRLATMTAPTIDALLAVREGIVAAAEHDPLDEAFTSICGSHQDYIWDVKDQGP